MVLPIPALFGAQALGFTLAWFTLTWTLLRPRVDALAPRERLAIWVAPECFRFLGVGLAVPALAPGLDPRFAATTAAGDSLTALLAIATLWLIHREHAAARALAWVTSLFGLVDAALALAQAPFIDAANHLAAQWFVPVLVLPLMLIAHGMTIRELRRSTGRVE